jgi:excisionase family DNA binding protein
MKTLSTNDVAKQLGVSRQTVYNWIKSGKLPAVQVGSVYRVTQEVVDAFAKPVQPKTDKSGGVRHSSMPA